MLSLIKVEMIKLRSSFAFKIVLLVCVAICLISVASYIVMSNLDMSSLDENQMLMMMQVTGYDIFMSVMTNNSDIILFATIIICILIGSDFSGRTLQAQITAGYSRTKIFLSRYISSCVAVLIVMIVYLLIMVGGTSIGCGFGVEINAELIKNMIIQIFMCMFVSFSMISMYQLIAFACKSVGISLGVCMPVLFLGTTALAATTLINDFFEKLYTFTPFGQILEIANESLDAMGYVKFFGVNTVFAVIMMAIGILSFRKAELK